MHAATLSFRAGDEFAEQTRALASLLGLKSSDYIRQAVREKNEQVMAQRKDQLKGDVVIWFQPGEEGYGGAEYMLDEGLLDVPKHADGSASPITAAYAIHITSSMPAGFLGTKGGPIMASSDRLDIIITGKGGHASEPFRTLDPVPVASEIVLALHHSTLPLQPYSLLE